MAEQREAMRGAKSAATDELGVPPRISRKAEEKNLKSMRAPPREGERAGEGEGEGEGEG